MRNRDTTLSSRVDTQSSQEWTAFSPQNSSIKLLKWMYTWGGGWIALQQILQNWTIHGFNLTEQQYQDLKVDVNMGRWMDCAATHSAELQKCTIYGFNLVQLATVSSSLSGCKHGETEQQYQDLKVD
ncbi:hypothetical protein TrispH2_011842, partial [Trichoplax sp. H2]